MPYLLAWWSSASGPARPSVTPQRHKHMRGLGWIGRKRRQGREGRTPCVCVCVCLAKQYQKRGWLLPCLHWGVTEHAQRTGHSLPSCLLVPARSPELSEKNLVDPDVIRPKGRRAGPDSMVPSEACVADAFVLLLYGQEALLRCGLLFEHHYHLCHYLLHLLPVPSSLLHAMRPVVLC